MLIEDKVLKYWIDNFYGYGSWYAKFWFVGYEESGGDIPEEVTDKLNYFFVASPGSSLQGFGRWETPGLHIQLNQRC